MQSTMTRTTQPTRYGSAQVWDLNSAPQRRYTPRARPSRAGAVAASFGIAALAVAVVPAVAIETRLFFAVALGLVAAVVGISALRRRQTTTALLLAFLGVIAPAVAVASAVLQTTGAPATVTSSTVPRDTIQPDSSSLVSTRDFSGLATDEQGAMRAFLSATVLQMQTMHGSWAPLPASLAISNGALVEGDGLFRGTTLGAVPQNERLTYQVSSDGTAFRIAISSSSDPDASISAERALPIAATG